MGRALRSSLSTVLRSWPDPYGFGPPDKRVVSRQSVCHVSLAEAQRPQFPPYPIVRSGFLLNEQQFGDWRQVGDETAVWHSCAVVPFLADYLALPRSRDQTCRTDRQRRLVGRLPYWRLRPGAFNLNGPRWTSLITSWCERLLTCLDGMGRDVQGVEANVLEQWIWYEH